MIPAKKDWVAFEAVMEFYSWGWQSARNSESQVLKSNTLVEADIYVVTGVLRISAKVVKTIVYSWEGFDCVIVAWLQQT
ncbi:hypothetical protein Tsubulata_046161, partial [Turnera subulata]